MNKVLLNIALFSLTDFCKAHGVNVSGTHAVKHGRGFTFRLIRSDTAAPVASVTFSKNSTPRFIIFQ